MNKSEKELLADFIIETAKKAGAHEVSVNLAENSGMNIQFRDGEIEQLEESQENSLSISIYCDNKYSSHSTNNLKPDDIKIFTENAVKATHYLTSDPFRQLPDSRYYAKNLDKDLNLSDQNFHNITTEDRIEISKRIYESAIKHSDKIISAAASYSDTVYSSLKVHSNGFCGHHSGTMFSASAEVTVKDNDTRPEDYYSVQNRFLSRFPDVEMIGNLASTGALKKMGQTKIKTGTYNMLVENRAAIRLISMLLSPMAASSIQQKSSYLDGMLGKKIASEMLNITDNPLIDGALGSRLFDSEGIASVKRSIIENGVLCQYFIDSYYGKKLGMEPNGGSSSNLLFSDGSDSLDSLMKQASNGILVTGFNGGNSNSTTGDFSFGISGFQFENGNIIKPINEMNISGNSKILWNNLVKIANDPYPYSKWMVPSLLFEGVSFSGL